MNEMMKSEEQKLAQSLLDRYNKLSGERYNYETFWQMVSDYVLPNRTDFIIKRSPGDPSSNRKRYDSTAITANKLLASTLHSGLTSDSQDWFDLTLSEPAAMNEEARYFLAAAKKQLMEYFNSTASGFQSQVHEFYLSLTAYGTAVMYIEEKEETGEIKFCSSLLSGIYISENKYGEVDTVFRKFELTARQAAQMWPYKRLHQNIIACIEKDPDKKFTFLHVVLPRVDLPSDAPVLKKFPVSSLYIDIDNAHLISKSGYYQMPYIVARFEKLAGESYGRGPAWDSMPDIRMLNQMSKDFIQSSNYAALPLTLVSDDGVVLPKDLRPGSVIVGGISSIDGTQRVGQLNMGGNLSIGVEMYAMRQKAIREAFFVDQLMFKEGTPVTATEAVQRQEEKLRMLGPHLGRMQHEFLNPLIERVFTMLLMSGRLGRVPEILQGTVLKVEYKSPLIRLQKSNEVFSLGKFLQVVAPIAQLEPSALDILNIDRVVANIADAAGLNLLNLRNPREIAAIRENRARQQQMQEQLMMLREGAAAGKDLAAANSMMPASTQQEP